MTQNVTYEMIEQHASTTGAEGAMGWTKNALACLGVTWPPKKGWKERIVGQPHMPLPGSQALIPCTRHR